MLLPPHKLRIVHFARWSFRSLALLFAFAVSACASPNAQVPAPGDFSMLPSTVSGSSGPIKHIIIMVQENRTFDNLFATYPGADGATTGKLHTGAVVPLHKNALYTWDMDHTYPAFLTAYDHGKLDGFDLIHYDGPGGIAGTIPYQYVDPAQIGPYWSLAQQYVLADHMFQTQGSGSFTAHQDLIAGGTQILPGRAIVDYPSVYNAWGCDAWKPATTSEVTYYGQYIPNAGPFPCFTYKTMRDVLDAKGVSWRYYAPEFEQRTIGALWSAFDAISAVRFGTEWKTNISNPETNVFSDLKNGKLAAVNWLIPDGYNSDHPQDSQDTGPSWVGQVVNAVGKSQYWKSTAIVVVWDDWGGFYDHVPPRRLGFGGLGFRVPCLIVSPYAKKGYISHTNYEFGSILKFIEENWGLDSLGTSDVRAKSIGDVFDFTQTPRRFVTIQTKYPLAHFLNAKPSHQPLDSE